ncbi:hypothetical protein Rs2_19327 [Raphanus sativus]|nr:hypothetical protein Rs2_19327 [Raphanus sativus]
MISIQCYPVECEAVDASLLDALPTMFKFACSDFGRPETSGVVESLWESSCSSRFSVFLFLFIILIISQVDLNRAGAPLLEIVTQPYMGSGVKAGGYASEME